MSAKARAALKKLEVLEAKRAQVDRLYDELRESLLHEAYGSRSHVQQLGPNPHRRGSVRQTHGPESCGRCGWQFVPGETVLEYVESDGRVVARYHAYADECSRAMERHPEWQGLYP